MTNKEWQDRYRITSTKGKIWTRSEVRKRAVDMAYALFTATQPRSVIGTAVELVLDNDAFMRLRSGEVPARVVEAVAFEAFYSLSRQAAKS